MLGKRCLVLLALCLLNGVFSHASVLANNNQWYDYRFVRDLTKHLHSRHNFHGLVTFSEYQNLIKPLRSAHYLKSLERFLAENLPIPLLICGMQTTDTLRGIISKQDLILCTIHSLKAEQEPMLKVVHEKLVGLHDLRTLFILNTDERLNPSMKQLNTFFHWCWSHKFINVALTYQRIIYSNDSFTTHNELFSYTPFPTIQVSNVTNMGVTYNWEAIDLDNVQGYEFLVPVFQDWAYAFLVSEPRLLTIAFTYLNCLFASCQMVSYMELLASLFLAT